MQIDHFASPYPGNLSQPLVGGGGGGGGMGAIGKVGVVRGGQPVQAGGLAPGDGQQPRRRLRSPAALQVGVLPPALVIPVTARPSGAPANGG